MNEEPKWGARQMPVSSDSNIGRVAGFGVELSPDHPRPAGWGCGAGKRFELLLSASRKSARAFTVASLKAVSAN
jgi:hypothetical protein